jgi:hypothetical protein
MNAMRSKAKVRVGLKVGVGLGLAMHLRVDRFRVGCTLDEAQTNNRRLIFLDRNFDGAPGPRACSPAFTNHALEAASGRQTPILNSMEASLCAGI